MLRCDVLTECDRPGIPSDQIALIRLQDAAQRGELLSSNDHTTIRALIDKLGIRATKHLSVATIVRGRVERDSFFLTQPLGPYYTRLTVPQKIIHREEVTRAWETNPIELAEVFDILSLDNLKNSGLQTCPVVSLHFNNSNLAVMMRVLVELKLEECKTLELRNLKIQTSQIPALKNRMSWPKLESIILKG